MLKKIVLILTIIISILINFIPSILNIGIILNISLAIVLLILLSKNNIDNNDVEDDKVDIIKDNVPIIENVIEYIDKPKLEQKSHYEEQLFLIKECLPMINKLSTNIQDFEEKSIKELFEEFEDIWRESSSIVTDSEDSMKSIFDENNENNLGYVLKSSREIGQSFAEFIPVLKIMSNLTDRFINTSVQSFEAITKTTKDIVDLAEHVKVISINVRIEAARVTDSGGFNVLGNDISNFADKTSLVALSTNKQIKETMSSINTLKEELTSQLQNVEKMANEINYKISPFEGILASSSDSIMDVIKNLNKISTTLQHDLRNSMSKMQYQDITKQESEHIVKLIDFIQDNNFIEKKNILINDDKKREIRKEIIAYLRKIITTENEEKEIVEIAKKWNVEIAKVEEVKSEIIDDGVFLF